MSNMPVTDQILFAKIKVLGNDATESQSASLENWILSNYGQDHLLWAAEQTIDVGDVYTNLTMRLGEMGI